MATALLLLLCVIALASQSARALPQAHRMLNLYETPERMREESEQVAAMDSNEISAFDTDAIDAQAIAITNCGIAGNIVQAALQFGLAFVPNSNIVGVSINCALQVGSYVCTDVVVTISGTEYTSVRVCKAQNGNVCVKVNAAPKCQPSWLAAAIPLSIPIQTATVPATLKLDLLGTPCVAIVLAPNSASCSSRARM